jgi:DNA-binding NtrC family response regulator
MPRVLIVEDQERVARALALLLELHDIPSVIARSPEAALACLDSETIDLVLQDMNFTPGATSGEEGMALFAELRRRAPELPVILLTAWAHLQVAVRLTREGAVDYLEKPWDDVRLIATVRERLSAPPAARAATSGRAAAAAAVDLCGMVVESAAMRELVALAARVAAADVPVLITGPSGTGKEKLAEVIHANSPRRRRPFVRFDAAALPETLLEAELFGAEAGAYTGATKRRIGRFEAASGGTLLLDEIGNLTPTGQAKLLRVLQAGRLERLGSSQSIEVDVRIVAATNTDLGRAIAAGAFREDLYYRLAVIELDVPSLARRREDVLPLAERFLAAAERAGSEPLRLSEAARRALLANAWPGNVRELRNRIQRAALLATGTRVEPADLGLASARGSSPSPAPPPPAAARIPAPPFESPRGAFREEAAHGEVRERERIEAALVEAGGVVARAAESLGLSRQALYRRMERLGIVLERRPRS